MVLIVAAGGRNETQKLVAETVEGMREVKWPQNAGIVVSPHNGSSSRVVQARLVEPAFQMRCPLGRLAGEVLDELWQVQETVGVDGYQDRWTMQAFPLQEYTQLRELLRERAKQRRTHSDDAP